MILFKSSRPRHLIRIIRSHEISLLCDVWCPSKKTQTLFPTKCAKTVLQSKSHESHEFTTEHFCKISLVRTSCFRIIGSTNFVIIFFCNKKVRLKHACISRTNAESLRMMRLSKYVWCRPVKRRSDDGVNVCARACVCDRCVHRCCCCFGCDVTMTDWLMTTVRRALFTIDWTLSFMFARWRRPANWCPASRVIWFVAIKTRDGQSCVNDHRHRIDVLKTLKNDYAANIF